MPRRTPLNTWTSFPQPFLTCEAVAAGLSSRAIAGATARGDLIRIAPGLYAASARWACASFRVQHLGLCRAAMASTPDVALSHVSAALAYGLPEPLAKPSMVTLAAWDDRLLTASSGPGEWKRVLHGALCRTQCVERADLLCTSPSRTVADCLRVLWLRDGLAIADGALRRGLTTTEEVRLERLAQRRWPGVKRIDAALPLMDGRRESWLESASVAVACDDQGFSVPESQIRIHDLSGRFIGRVDMLWRDAGVIGEADGRGKYRGDFDDHELTSGEVADRILAERDRERALEALGFGVARWGIRDLWQRGAPLAAQLRAAAARARPHSIKCLWRADDHGPLRPWSPLPAVVTG